MPRKYIKKSVCNETLEAFLTLLNLLPSNLYEHLEKFKKLEDKDTDKDTKRNLLKKCFDGLHPIVKESLKNIPSEYLYKSLKELNFDCSRLRDLCEHLEDERRKQEDIKIFNQFARKKVSQYFRMENPIKQKEYVEYLEMRFHDLVNHIPKGSSPNQLLVFYSFVKYDSFKVSPSPLLQINDLGFLELRLSFLDQVVMNSIKSEQPIEADRIRVCHICKKFFWLKSKKFKSCGNTKCVEKLGNFWRTRKIYISDLADELCRNTKKDGIVKVVVESISKGE